MLLELIKNENNSVVEGGTFNKSSGEESYKLDLSSLVDGAYYLGVEINGKLAAIQKLMIMK